MIGVIGIGAILYRLRSRRIFFVNGKLLRSRSVHRFTKQIGLNACRYETALACGDVEFRSKNPFTDRFKFELGKDRAERFAVTFFHPEIFNMKFNRHIGDDGGQLLTHYRQIGAFTDLLAQRAFNCFRIGQNIFKCSEFSQQLRGGLFTDARYTGYIINRIAHQSQHINDLVNRFDIPFGTDLLRTHDLHFSALVSGFIDHDVIFHQLSVIFIRGYHIHRKAFPGSLLAKRSDDIISFITVRFNTGNAETFYNTLDVRNRCDQVFRSFLPVRFIIGEIVMARGGGMGIKTNGHMRWLLVIQQLN